MLFIVADVDSGSATASQDGAAIGARSVAPAVKVELDLEDAPFLEEDLEKKEAPKEEVKPANVKSLLESPAPAKPSLKERLLARKKTLILAGIATVLLVAAGIAVNIFIFSDKSAPVDTGPRRVTLQDAPPPETAPEAVSMLVEWEPFLVNTRGSQGEIRFLHCKFSIPTTSTTLYGELITKRIALRDAVYYYLRNKPLTFLADKVKQKELKDDLISVINEHLSSAKISELYFEEYVVTGDEYPAISPTPSGTDGPRGEAR